MKNKLILKISFILLISIPHISFGWGKKGHELVAEVAYNYLDDATKAKVKVYLGKMSIEDAANWMDEVRSNDYYNYMKTWHYIDFEKGEHYNPQSADRNLIIILNSAIAELERKQDYKKKQLKKDLLMVFHLMGDLHQPLHVGYPGDKGGNTINVSFAEGGGSSNLHRAWDTDIIEANKISLADCLKQYDTYTKEEIAGFQQIKIMQWMDQSRSLLDFAYSFKEDGVLDKNYVDSAAVLIEKQILKAGLRLASVLKVVLNDPAPNNSN